MESSIGRTIFKSWIFWIIIISLLVSISFLFLGDKLEIENLMDFKNRLFYSTLFFLGVVIVILLYIVFTKPEEREARKEAIRRLMEDRRRRRELRKIKKSAINELKKKFYEALGIIKKSDLYKKRLSYNYELPWYLVLGGNENEQRSLLLSSGLHFPINIEYKEDSGIDRGKFQWFFAEEGVFVTVPKEYITLDKNSSTHPVWIAFLKLFKKERWRRPVNGIIFTINTSELLNKSELELTEYSKVVREKLDEINKTFSSKIPIYLIVTGMKSLTSFEIFFSSLTSEEKKEVLGITLEDNIEDITEVILKEKFSALVSSLEEEMLTALQDSWSENERKKIFLFIDSFKNLLANVKNFSLNVFSNNRYFSPLMLRGIYFTAFNNIDFNNKALTVVEENGTSGSKTFFTPRVFNRIILSEQELVTVNESYRRKLALMWGGIFLVLTLSFAALVAYWSDFVKKENQEVKAIEEVFTQYKDLLTKSRPKIVLKRKAKKLETIIEIGKLGGNVDAGVSFGEGNANLTPYARTKLYDIANDILSLDPSTKIKIVGHTDSIGDEEYNLNLSLMRAAAVKQFFIDFGIDSDRITVEGAGESSPVASNDTVEGRSLNRRVEIYAYGLKIQKDEEPYEEIYTIENRLSDLQRVLAMLDALSSMRRDANDSIDKQYWKPGYYVIAQRDKKVHELYNESLKTLLLPRVATIIESEILKNLSNILSTQTNLKAYLMLSDEKHRDTEFLRSYMLNRWGEDLDESEIKRLNIHFASLLKTNFSVDKLNHKTIFRARKKLLSEAGIAGLIYKNLQEEALRMGLKDFQFLSSLDSYPNTFTGAEYRIPGFFTKEGYEKIILLEAKKIIKKYLEKSWILGDDDEVNRSEINRVYEKVLSLYFLDYRRYWTKAITKLEVSKYKTIDELVEQLELLSSGVSPVVMVLRAIKKNTYLLTPKERAEEIMRKKRESGISASEVLGSVGSKIDRAQRLTTVNMGKFSGDSLVFDLRNIFKPYHELIDENGMPSGKLKVVIRHIEKAYQKMLDVETAPNSKEAAFEIVKKRGATSHKNFVLKSGLLPPKLVDWYSSALEESWRYLVRLIDGHIDQTYNNEIWSFYVNRIKGRFPININSASEIDIDDFKIFFKKNGLLDEYFNTYVLPFVDIDFNTGRYRLKKRDEAFVTIDRRTIMSIVRFKKIQKLFFHPNGVNLQVKFKVYPKSLNKKLGAMDFIYGDKEVVYEHGPKDSSEFLWPAKYPDILAKFTLYDQNSNRVVKVRGKGPWAPFRLFEKLDKQIISSNKMEIGYYGKSNSGAFIVEGDIVSIFSPLSPLQRFRLIKK